MSGKDIEKMNPSPPPWIELPNDLTANILHRVGAIGLLHSAQRVCSTWWRVCQDPAMWRVVDFTPDWDCYDYMMYGRIADSICRHAVDRSHGQLIDITFEYLCTDQVLLYLAQRSRNLRRLTLVTCTWVRGEDLVAAVKNFPNLEELHLVFLIMSASGVESVGMSCPKLSSFSYNDCEHRIRVTNGNDYALAVAKSMPNLRHLQLYGIGVENEGVVAILDGCQRLESLDLRRCGGVGLLQEDVAKRCSQQIKIMRFPCDSDDDYKWKHVFGGARGGLLPDSDSDSEDEFSAQVEAQIDYSNNRFTWK